jgi:hypothetical protein
MLDVVRPWAKDADSYSSGLTNTAYAMIKRNCRPMSGSESDRSREGDAVLQEARKNIGTRRGYTQIAIDQIDGNRSFFRRRSPAFKDVADKALLEEFTKTNAP